MGPGHQGFRPSAERRVPLGHIRQSRSRSMDQLPAQISVAALADPQQLRLAAGGELPRNQTEPGGEIAAAVEAFRMTDGGDESRRDDRADARNCRQPAGVLILLGPANELGVEGGDPPIELRPLRAGVLDQAGSSAGSSRLRLARP